jgi:hypothetical protein
VKSERKYRPGKVAKYASSRPESDIREADFTICYQLLACHSGHAEIAWVPCGKCGLSATVAIAICAVQRNTASP